MRPRFYSTVAFCSPWCQSVPPNYREFLASGAIFTFGRGMPAAANQSRSAGAHEAAVRISIGCSPPAGSLGFTFFHVRDSARISGVPTPESAAGAGVRRPRLLRTCSAATSSSARPRCGAFLCASQSRRCIAALHAAAVSRRIRPTDLAWGRPGRQNLRDRRRAGRDREPLQRPCPEMAIADN